MLESDFDKILIKNLVDEYQAALNLKNWDHLSTLFTEDGAWEALEPLNMHLAGREAIIEGFRSSIDPMDLIFAQMTGVLVSSLTAETADVQCSVYEVGRETGKQDAFLALGFYSDSVAKRDGRWVFTRRTFHSRHIGGVDLSGHLFPVSPGALTQKS